MDSQLSRIDLIKTHWSHIQKSVSTDERESTRACLALFHRYERSVYKYLIGAVQDPHVADELFQEFSMRLVSGRFSNVTPERGRFRDYLRRALQNLVTDWYRKTGRENSAQIDDLAGCGEGDDDRTFNESFRSGILEKAIQSLEEYEVETGRPLATALKLRMKTHGKTTSAQLAEGLTEATGSRDAISAAGYRKTLERARIKFAELLIAEVSRTIEIPTPESIDAELAELGLLAYLRR